MSDDWVEKHLEAREQKLRRDQSAEKRQRLTEVGATAKFHGIKRRVQQDLNALHKVEAYQSLELREGVGGNFFVMSRSFTDPFAPFQLIVNLEMILVKYIHELPSKKGGRGPHRDEGVLRLCSDLDGVIQVYRDGDVFADESDISEFLLKPLLEFLDQ